MRGKPSAIRCDYGPGYIAHALVEWTENPRVGTATAAGLGVGMPNHPVHSVPALEKANYLRLTVSYWSSHGLSIIYRELFCLIKILMN